MPGFFGLGGDASLEDKYTSGTFDKTRTPIVPDWANNLTQGVAGRVGSLLNLDPYSLVAPAQGLQTQAGDAASRLSGSPWNYDGAADLTRGAANTSWVDGYMNT